MSAHVLVIEDDDQMAERLSLAIGRAGFGVVRVASGRAGLREAYRENPDLVVLDVGLPDLDGWQVLERLRDISEVPVLMLTAPSESYDRAQELSAGAADYLTKPFDNSELLARMDVLLQRHRASEDHSAQIVVDGALRIDLVRRVVLLDRREISVTPIEFRLLVALMRHPGQVLSPAQLLDLAWKDASGMAPDRVKFAVHRLRRKLGWDAENSPLEAVRGFGYRYRDTEST